MSAGGTWPQALALAPILSTPAAGWAGREFCTGESKHVSNSVQTEAISSTGGRRGLEGFLELLLELGKGQHPTQPACVAFH